MNLMNKVVSRVKVMLMTMLLSGGLCSVSGATTYYVRTTGSDGNSGASPTEAWRTVKKAASTLTAGDTVYVGAGNYAGSVQPRRNGTSANPIKFIADTAGVRTGDAGTVRLSDNRTYTIFNRRHYIHFIGFTIDTGRYGMAIVNGTGVLVQNCTIHTDRYPMVTYRTDVTIKGCNIHSKTNIGIYALRSGKVTILDSSIHDCRREGIKCRDQNVTLDIQRCMIYGNKKEGIDLDRCTATILNCLIYNQGADGIEVDNSSANVTIWHCTIAVNSDDGIKIKRGNVTVTNCIIANNNDDGIDFDNGEVNHNYNCVYGNGSRNFEGTSQSSGEITSDPLLAGSGDYHVLAGSPTLDAAIDAATVTNIDLFGNSRPSGGGWDMGCYEGAAPPPLFTNVSSATGFNVQTTTGYHSASGLHWGDLDNDGDLDAIATGDSSSRVFMSTNAGASFFVGTLGSGSYSRQGALLDIDNDGDIDFWHTAEVLFQNDGSGGLSNAGNLGFSSPSNNEGVAAGDFNLDGWIDLAMFSGNGNWIGLHQGSASVSISGSSNRVYGLNDGGDEGNGDFCSSGDVNNDGIVDFFYHYGSGKLFLSDGDGTWTENPSGISVVTGNSDKMGSAWADFDNDGDLDLFVPRYDSGKTGYLWRNDSGVFSNVTNSAGLSNISSQRSCCWGDYDNDGDLDLYITTTSGGNILYRNNGDATFTTVNEGVATSGNSHDAVFVDYDNDGDLDLAVTRERSTTVLLRNGTDDENYLKVRVLGIGAGGTNKACVGVRIDLYASNGTTLLARRDIGSARGYGGTEPLWAHFGGVDKSSTYVVKVHFLSGIQQVTVIPENVSTTIGSTTIAQMLFVQEPATGSTELIQWMEKDPVNP